MSQGIERALMLDATDCKAHPTASNRKGERPPPDRLSTLLGPL